MNKEKKLEAQKSWYARNSAQHKANVRLRVLKEREKDKAYLDSLRTACKLCGERDIRCLDFHHRDPESKKFNITSKLGKISRKKLDSEIAKCDILCANCHRKSHLPP